MHNSANGPLTPVVVKILFRIWVFFQENKPLPGPEIWTTEGVQGEYLGFTITRFYITRIVCAIRYAHVNPRRGHRLTEDA